jgi:hypothetical protein
MTILSAFLPMTNNLASFFGTSAMAKKIVLFARINQTNLMRLGKCCPLYAVLPHLRSADPLRSAVPHYAGLMK